jgi:DNA-binding transcriptional LysR family regulator
MEILALRYFCHAAQTESFSRTAQSFYVPTSSISQVIKRIEEEVGAELFIRLGNRVRLSVAGKRFYERVSVALSELEDATRELKEGTSNVRGEIRLLVLTERRIVADSIESFMNSYPEGTFTIDHTNEKGRNINLYDLTVSSLFSVEKGVCRIPFIKDKMLLAIPEGHPLSRFDDITPQDLKDQRFITMNDESPLYGTTLDIFHSMGIDPEISIKCDDPSLIQRYVKMGLGLAIVPSVSWRDALSDGVKLYPLCEFSRTAYIYHRKTDNMPTRVKLFLEHLLKSSNIDRTADK